MDKSLPRTNREVSPCYGCQERYPACSSHCPKDERGERGYLAWKNAVKVIEDNRKAYYKMLDEYRRKKWNG